MDEDSDVIWHTRNFFAQQFHPLEASLGGFNDRSAAGTMRSRKKVSPVPPQLRAGYKKDLDKRYRLDSSNEAHVDDVVIARNFKETKS